MEAIEQLVDVDAFEEFIARPENRHRLFELIDGRIFEKLPTQVHGSVTAYISYFLIGYVESGHPGRVGVEVRHRPARDFRNDRIPDVVLNQDVSSPMVDAGPVLGMPALAVEIKSPDDSLKEMVDAANYYLQNGCKMVWLIYPERQLIEVLTPDKRDFFGIEDTLTGGDVLPGLEIPVRKVFIG